MLTVLAGPWQKGGEPEAGFRGQRGTREQAEAMQGQVPKLGTAMGTWGSPQLWAQRLTRTLGTRPVPLPSQGCSWGLASHARPCLLNVTG